MLLSDIDFENPNVDDQIEAVLSRLDGVMDATTSENFGPDAVLAPVTEAREVVDKEVRQVIAKLGDELAKAKSYIDGQNDTIQRLTNKIVVRGDIEPITLDKSDVDKLIEGEVI